MDDPTHPSVPDSDPAPSVPNSVHSDAPEAAEDLTHLPPEYRAVVRRLRAQVERATTALHRLQRENERLRRRLEELEAQPALQPDTTTLVLDDDPAELRGDLSSFIDAIDTFLDGETTSESSAPAPNASS